MSVSGRARVMAAFVGAVALHVLAISIWPSSNGQVSPEPAIHIVGLYHELASDAASLEQVTAPEGLHQEKTAPAMNDVLTVPQKEAERQRAQEKEPAPIHDTSHESKVRVAKVAKPAVEEAVKDSADRNLPASIYAGIMTEMHYPRMARRNGWQGEVALRLDVRDRTIRQVTMLASSGYPLLDRAAHRGIGRIRTLPLADGYYRLPVIFRLQ